MNKKYQVFVSSTYMDLIEERQEIMQALLELDCIPVGMELFPAADDDQWTLIKGLIKDCDYYLVVVGGRYGSLGPSGKSYTHMEYEFAVEEGIPTIGFIHSDPGKIASEKTESEPESRQRLEEFKNLVQQKMCRFWSSPEDLGSKVSRSLVKLIKSKPRIGWIKADIVTSEEANTEISRLRKENEELKSSLKHVSTNPPVGTESLKQGDDELTIRYSYYYGSDHFKDETINWNQIFYLVGPTLISESTEDGMKEPIADYMRQVEQDKNGKRPRNLMINDEDFQTIKVQLMALGLIIKNEKKRSITDQNNYWTLTPYGENTLMKLRALKK